MPSGALKRESILQCFEIVAATSPLYQRLLGKTCPSALGKACRVLSEPVYPCDPEVCVEPSCMHFKAR